MRPLNVSVNNSSWVQNGAPVLLPNQGISKETQEQGGQHKDNPPYLRLEIKMKTLTDLIARNVLVVEDLRCLDRSTKIYLKQLLLANMVVCRSPR